jgi:hypoxanthine phosphoribosyltransferase
MKAGQSMIFWRRQPKVRGMERRECVISDQELALRVRELGRRITGDYQGRRLLVVGILNGAFIFMADLIRQIDLPVELDFLRVSSYGGGKSSSGTLKFTKDIELPVEGKDVLLVEDIVDTGLTIFRLTEILLERKADSVRTCVLIDKRERREHSVHLDYTGFVVEQGFLVGYGLDCDEQLRQLPGVYRLAEGE